MDEEIKTDIAVIKERIQNLTDQNKRFLSHLESEQRVTNNISKRLDILEHTVSRIQDEKSKREISSKWRIETIISLMALAGTMAALFLRN